MILLPFYKSIPPHVQPPFCQKRHRPLEWLKFRFKEINYLLAIFGKRFKLQIRKSPPAFPSPAGPDIARALNIIRKKMEIFKSAVLFPARFIRISIQPLKLFSRKNFRIGF